ncbi:hypothetical protein M9H77_03777 [Catharanthus roseus]|uniref:Uncharacterized protein n=1 Tax=Catharanthus roseus TaxID=4058 RepID=A0ACC0CC78_CATRO|nr:hypothetical protein M9H77_03777 [Catharanthus roseus]
MKRGSNFFHEDFGDILCIIQTIEMYREKGPEVKDLTSQSITGVDYFIRQCLESNNGSENSLSCKNKKIIHSKVVREHLLQWVLCLVIIIGQLMVKTFGNMIRNVFLWNVCFTPGFYWGRKFTVIAG